MLEVIAEYQVEHDKYEEVIDLLNRHATTSREEPGCTVFEVFQSSSDPTHVILLEAYEDESAYQKHRRSEHFIANIEGTLRPCLISRQWSRFQRLSTESGSARDSV
ncbi:putative quinol monooxygenase [Rhodococcus opacus]|uniref:putative quinol monooxygenase n=1 Tax=Rhodococcus opacus TaxID=37919 RepID=UPI00155ACEAC|nr:putative quinol monooxygenase [Rhodococcus opacus]